MSTSFLPPDRPVVPIDLDQVDRYLSGRASPSEMDEMQRVLASDPVAARVVAELRASSRPTAEPRDVQIDWLAHRRRVFGEVKGRTGAMGGVAYRAGRGPLTRWWYSAAGAAAAAVGLLTALWGTSRSRGVATVAGSGYVTYATRNGQRADITFPDGSSAVLNVGSHLYVPTNYSAGNRTVRLDGEALFSVVHHAGTPFTVVSGPTTTRVLGTSFLVRRYATDTATLVAVRDGKVAVQAIILAGNQRATVGRGNVVRVARADPSCFTFTTGVLTLDGVPLRDAISDLDRWYDVDLRIADSALASNRIQATFTAGSISNLSAILEMAFGVRVVRDGRVLTLYRE